MNNAVTARSNHLPVITNLLLALSLSLTSWLAQANSNTHRFVPHLYVPGHYEFANGINLVSGDYNQDGNTEAYLLTGNSDRLQILEPVNGKLQFSRQINLPAPLYLGMQVFSIPALQTDLLFLANRSMLVQVDLRRRALAKSLTIKGEIHQLWQLPAKTGTDAKLLVSTENQQLHLVNPVSLTIEYSLTLPVRVVAVGQFSATEGVDLLCADGSIYRLSERQLIAQTSLKKSFDKVLPAGDIDHDGIDDLFVSEGERRVSLYSPGKQQTVWHFQPEWFESGEVGYWFVADWNQDQQPDLLYSELRDQSIYVLDGRSGKQLEKFQREIGAANGFFLANLDKDAAAELIWSGSNSFTDNSSYLKMADSLTQTTEWELQSRFTGGVAAITLGDINGDQNSDVLLLTDGQTGSGLLAINVRTGRTLWQQQLSSFGATLLRIAQLEPQSTPTLLAAMDDLNATVIRRFDGNTGEQLFEASFAEGQGIRGLTHVDLNQDGHDEIVFSHNRKPAQGDEEAKSGSQLYMLSSSNGALLYQTPAIGNSTTGWHDLTVWRFGKQTKLLGLIDDQLFQYDVSSKVQSRFSPLTQLKQLVIVSNGNQQSIIVANDSGRLFSIDSSGNSQFLGQVCAKALGGLSAAGPQAVLLTCVDENALIEFDLATNTVSYRHPVGQYLPQQDTATLTFMGERLFALGGNALNVLRAETVTPLTTPNNIVLRGHYLKPLQGQLSSNSPVDYFAWDDTPAVGTLSNFSAKSGTFTFSVAKPVKLSMRYHSVVSEQVSPTAEVNIDAYNTTPLAAPMQVSTHWRKPLKFSLQGQDADSEPLQYQLIGNASHGQLTLIDASSGQVEYQPSGQQIDAIAVTYRASDAISSSVTQPLTIVLTNTAPTATSGSFDAPANQLLQQQLTGGDADGDPVEFVLTQGPISGQLTLDGKTGRFSYQPASNTDHQVSFSYVVADKFAKSAAATVTVQLKQQTNQGAGSGSGSEKSGGAGVSMLLSSWLVLLYCLRNRRRIKACKRWWFCNKQMPR